MSILLRCSSISDLLTYFSTLPSYSISASCILLLLNNLGGCDGILYFDTPSHFCGRIDVTIECGYVIARLLMSKNKLKKRIFGHELLTLPVVYHINSVLWTINFAVGYFG